MNELPIKIQTIVFRKIENEVEVLLVKRSERDGGFWQTITGTLELGENILESRARELLEETGIKNILNWSEELYRFSWQKKHYTVVELVFVAEVSFGQDIVLSSEHTNYMWVCVDKAINIIEKSNIKDSLLKFKQWLDENNQ